MAKVPFTVRIDAAERRALRTYAELRKRTTASDLVRKAIGKLLADAKAFDARYRNPGSPP